MDAVGYRERIEHFDAAIVFDVHEDSELAEKYMNLMNAIKLDNGQKIKVCLYNAPNFKPEAAELATDVVQYCTHIFFVLTKNFPLNLPAKLIKEEAIGLTRLAVNGEEGCPGLEGRRYCVRHLHSLPPGQRDYKIPPGFSTIRGFDMSNEIRSKKELTELFKYNLHWRLKREYFARSTPVVNGCDQKPVTYSELPNTSEETTITVEASTGSFNPISGIPGDSAHNSSVANKDKLPSGQSNHVADANNDSTCTNESTEPTIQLSSESRGVGASINNDVTPNDTQSQLSIDAGSPSSLNRNIPRGGDETQAKKFAISVETSSSDYLQHKIDILKDIGIGEHFMEYTSGQPSVGLEGFNHISRPVNNETNRAGRDAKKYTKKRPNKGGREIHFINCSNIQIGERGHWNIDKPNTIYSGTGQDQPTPINEIVDSDSEDSDDDSEYEMEPEFGYRATPSTNNQSSSKPMADLTGTQNQSSSNPMEDLTGTQNQSSSKPMEDLTGTQHQSSSKPLEDLIGTQNELNMTSDKPWNIDSYENTEVKQLIETGPSPELNNSTVKDIPTKSVSNNNQAISSDQEGLGDNFLNVMNIFGSSDSNNLSLSSFGENQDNLLIPEPTQETTPEVCDERILACLGTTGVIEKLVLDAQEGGSGNNVNSNSLRSIWWQLSSMPRSVSFHNIAQLIGLQHTHTKPNGDDEETD
ncbi:hypothetical protein SNE40_015449 [Patella caerulea]